MITTVQKEVAQHTFKIHVSLDKTKVLKTSVENGNFIAVCNSVDIYRLLCTLISADLDEIKASNDYNSSKRSCLRYLQSLRLIG